LKANHKDKNYKGQLVKVGSLLTGRELLSQQTGLSVRQVRTCLERLKSTNEVTIKSSKQGTIIEVVKYKNYQVMTNETTTCRPTNDQQTTTNKNVKNEKEVMLDEWIEYRKQIKKPIRQSTIGLLKKEMDSYSNDKCRFVINLSITNGWQGLFWDRYIEPSKVKTSDDELFDNVMRKLNGV
jgi:hypothetical protein